MDEIAQRLESFVSRHGLLPGEQSVLVACSGGADSLALLVSLRQCFPGMRIGCAHFEHGIRGAASLADMEFVRDQAAGLGIPLHAGRGQLQEAVDGVPGHNLEAEARRQRYHFLHAVAEAEGYHWIALGHTADDQVETILYKFFRGGALASLAGMPAQRGRIVRPLLECTRGGIEAWLRARGYTWREDQTNLDCRYRRNAIRHAILPLISSYFPDVRRRILETGRDAALENSELAHSLSAWGIKTREEAGGAVSWPWRALQAAPRSLVLRLLSARLAEQADAGSLPRKGLYRMLETRLERESDAGGTLYSGRAGILMLYRARLYCYPPGDEGYRVPAPGVYPAGEGSLEYPWGRILVSQVPLPPDAGRNFFQEQAGQGIFWINRAACTDQSVLRAVRPADVLRLSGHKGRCVADLLSGSGVPLPWRASVLVLATDSGCDAVFVPALPRLGRIGTAACVTPETGLALRFEIVPRRTDAKEP